MAACTPSIHAFLGRPLQTNRGSVSSDNGDCPGLLNYVPPHVIQESSVSQLRYEPRLQHCE